MGKSAVVLSFLLTVAPVFAQSTASPRAVSINNLSISGAPHISMSDLNAIEREMKSDCCDHAETEEIREQILWAFQKRGYIRTHINSLDVTPLISQTVPPAVAIVANLSDGQQYRLNAIQFEGNEALPTELLREQFPIHDSTVFNVEKIRQGLENLRKLYASYGYINFTPVPNTETDDAFAIVTLMIDCDEGRQFYLGDLLLDGEEPHAGDGARLLEAWKPMEGKIYDGSKIDEWWQLAATMLPPGSQLEQMLELRQDAASHIVTALLNFPK